VSQFDALKECGSCRHWMSGRYRNSPDIGTCGRKNKINGHDLMVRHDYCNQFEGKDSGPIIGTLEYLLESNRG
jgi:hypothetical protein